MTPDDFKKILDEALKPVNQKLDAHTTILEKHSNTLDSLSGAVVSIESKLDAYGDMYKINDSNVRKVEKRLEALEENADIAPPSEFVLADVS